MYRRGVQSASGDRETYVYANATAEREKSKAGKWIPCYMVLHGTALSQAGDVTLQLIRDSQNAMGTMFCPAMYNLEQDANKKTENTLVSTIHHGEGSWFTETQKIQTIDIFEQTKQHKTWEHFDGLQKLAGEALHISRIPCNTSQHKTNRASYDECAAREPQPSIGLAAGSTGCLFGDANIICKSNDITADDVAPALLASIMVTITTATNAKRDGRYTVCTTDGRLLVVTL